MKIVFWTLKKLFITDWWNIYFIHLIFKIGYDVSFAHWRKISRHKTTEYISFLFTQIDSHMQIRYSINSPWYNHSKLMLRILKSYYKLMSYTVDCRFTCTSKGVNSICTKVPWTNNSWMCRVFCNMLHYSVNVHCITCLTFRNLPAAQCSDSKCLTLVYTLSVRIHSGMYLAYRNNTKFCIICWNVQNKFSIYKKKHNAKWVISSFSWLQYNKRNHFFV